MNFTFDDNFKRFSLETTDQELYLAFIETPESELHFFDDNQYCGSLSFGAFKSSKYHFSRQLLKDLLLHVKIS